MARPFKQVHEPVRYEEDWSADNQDRCPGYRVMEYHLGEIRYETLVKCEYAHPHREMIRIDHGRERVPAFGWASSLLTEREARRAIEKRWKRGEQSASGAAEGLQGIRDSLNGFQRAGVNEGGKTPAGLHLVSLDPDIPPEVAEWLASIPPLESRDDDTPEG